MVLPRGNGATMGESLLAPDTATVALVRASGEGIADSLAVRGFAFCSGLKKATIFCGAFCRYRITPIDASTMSAAATAPQRSMGMLTPGRLNQRRGTTAG